MTDEELISLKRMGKNKNILVIPSLVMIDPSADELVRLSDELQCIINDITEYIREII